MSSYIYFTKAIDADEVNRIIEDNGYGPDSLSVYLINKNDQTQWRGAHSFVDLLIPKKRFEQIVTVEVYPDGNPRSNWEDALSKNDLEQLEINSNR